MRWPESIAIVAIAFAIAWTIRGCMGVQGF